MNPRRRHALIHITGAVIAVNAVIWGGELARLTYQRRVVMPARERALREDLRVMRKMIDQYTADHEAAPSSLEALVQKGYLPEVPIDPMTGSADTWCVILEHQPLGLDGVPGIMDVASGSDAVDIRGARHYRDW